MNRDRIEGIWKQVCGRLRQRWGMLISDQLNAIAGTQSQLAGRIQERCGITKEESQRQLKDFLHRNRNWTRCNQRGVQKGFGDDRHPPVEKSRTNSMVLIWHRQLSSPADTA